jgi:HSP20 family molecular chaperone IbpA
MATYNDTSALTTNSVLSGSLTISSPDILTSSNLYYGGYTSSAISFPSAGYTIISCFPFLIKSEETEEGLKYLFAVPGCGKESILVTYLEQDSFFKVEADHVEFLDKSNPCKIHVNTDKFDLSKIECSVKNGLLKVLVPYFEDAVPKSVKVS